MSSNHAFHATPFKGGNVRIDNWEKICDDCGQSVSHFNHVVSPEVAFKKLIEVLEEGGPSKEHKFDDNTPICSGHQPDFSTISYSHHAPVQSIVLDVRCHKCGHSGSFIMKKPRIDW